MFKVALPRPKHYLMMIISLLAVLILMVALAGLDLHPWSPPQAAAGAAMMPSGTDTSPLLEIYLPIVHKKDDLVNPFGLESHSLFLPGNYITNYTGQLHVNYARLNGRISWRELQPNEGDPINWALLADFELELRTMRTANITPIIVVDDYPRWATIYPTSCGPLLPERYDDFAVFVQALVERYSRYEFGVHIWEMGNEPDVDYRLLEVDSHYGCWGDWDDPFYNGRAYGDMLKVVTPAIHAVDPDAQVWIGGLLLASPNTIDDHIGQPEDFFRGILEAGAGPYIDGVAYHAYTHYISLRQDGDIYYEDKDGVLVWEDWGGIIRGKGRFLRSIMSQYDVSIPLYITETSQLCGWCSYYPETMPAFYDMQANLAPRSFTRAIADDISGFIWYTLEGPGWLNCGLLDENQVPKPAYYSYQTLSEMIGYSTYIGPASYGDGIEAYTFHKGAARIDVIFAFEDVSYTISVPQLNYIAAYDRFGALITPTFTGSEYLLNIRYEPIYLVRTR